MTTVADATVHVCLDFRQICMHDTETFTGSVCMPKFKLFLGQRCTASMAFKETEGNKYFFGSTR